MAVYVSDLFTATPAPVDANPTATRTFQWLRGSTAISGATSSTYTAVTADIGATIAASQIETNVAGTATATSAPTEVIQAFDPIRLFSASEPGVWYDPNDITTLYKGPTVQAPVTTPGDSVYLMLDKSKALVLGPDLFAGGFVLSTSTTVKNGASDGSVSVAGGVVTIVRNSTDAFLYPSASTYSATSSYELRFTVVSGPVTILTTFEALGPGTYRYICRAGTGFPLLWPNANSTAVLSNVSVKELPGNHALQPITASQPIYGIVPAGGRRNNITYSEQFDNSVWKFSNPGTTTIADQTSAPNSTLTADELREDTTTGTHRMFGYSLGWTTTTGLTYTFSIYVKANGRTKLQLAPSGIGLGAGVLFDLVAETAGAGGAIQNVGLGWYRCSVTGTSPSGGLLNPVLTLRDAAGVENYTGNGTSGVFCWGAQFELGSTATPYQRVTTQYDVTEAGVASLGYLFFDGSGDFMSTGTITPGTDKVQVFAGVRKLSDAAVGLVAELSATAGTNAGSFVLSAPASVAANYFWGGRGSAAIVGITTASSYAAPITNVLTGIGDISGDLSSIRVNGVAAGQSTADQGTGDFLAYQMYIGRRGGTTLPLNGHLFPLIVRFGPTLTAARIAATESWVASKTAGVTL